MATTNFKIFDENKQNIMSDSDYNSNTQRLNGVQQGIASSSLQNKALFQSSLMAYALAQLMVTNGYNANDSSAVSTFSSNLLNSIVSKVNDKATSQEAIAHTLDTKYLTPACLADLYTSLGTKFTCECGSFVGQGHSGGTQTVTFSQKPKYFTIMGKGNIWDWVYDSDYIHSQDGAGTSPGGYGILMNSGARNVHWVGSSLVWTLPSDSGFDSTYLCTSGATYYYFGIL